MHTGGCGGREGEGFREKLELPSPPWIFNPCAFMNWNITNVFTQRKCLFFHFIFHLYIKKPNSPSRQVLIRHIFISDSPLVFWTFFTGEGVGTSTIRTSTGQKFQNVEMVFLVDQNVEIRTSKMSLELITTTTIRTSKIDFRRSDLSQRHR